MRNLINIEKLPGKKHYTGYANGVWIIEKLGTRHWRAFRREDGTHIYAPNLIVMSQFLLERDKRHL